RPEPTPAVRAARFAFREIRDARAIGRPRHVRTVHQMPAARSIGTHDPQRRLPSIVELVDPPAGVDDLLTVGRELRILHVLEVEILLEGNLRNLRLCRAGLLRT